MFLSHGDGNGPRAYSGRLDGETDGQQGNIMASMTPSVKAEAVSDPTAPPNTLAAPVRRRSDDAGGIPERLAAGPALKPIKGHSGSSSECAGRF